MKGLASWTTCIEASILRVKARKVEVLVHPRGEEVAVNLQGVAVNLQGVGEASRRASL